MYDVIQEGKPTALSTLSARLDDPADAGDLLMARLVEGDLSVVSSVSDDGGGTWRRGCVPGYFWELEDERVDCWASFVTSSATQVVTLTLLGAPAIKVEVREIAVEVCEIAGEEKS